MCREAKNCIINNSLIFIVTAVFFIDWLIVKSKGTGIFSLDNLLFYFPGLVFAGAVVFGLILKKVEEDE